MTKGKNKHIKYEDVYKKENVELAYRIAKRGKAKKYGTKKFDKDYKANIDKICEELRERTFRTSEPKFERRFCEGKWRILAKVKFYDHVAHHALLNIIQPVLTKSYHYEAAASVKGRGIDYMLSHVRKYIDKHNTVDLYWKQIDFIKCYHHVKRQVLYDNLCKTFTDSGIRYMLHDVIWTLRDHNGLEPSDGSEGVGIGLTPVQPLINYHFNQMDRELSRVEGVKNFRYTDNILLIAFTPEQLIEATKVVEKYAYGILDQPIHENIGIQKLTDDKPIIYIGRKFFKNHTFVKNKTKYKLFRKAKKLTGLRWQQVMVSYKGILMHINGLKLWQIATHMKNFADLHIKREDTTVDGKRYFNVPTVQPTFLIDREIIVKDFEDNCTTQNGSGRMYVLVEENGRECKFCTNNPQLKSILRQIQDMNELPFKAKLKRQILSGNKIDYYFE